MEVIIRDRRHSFVRVLREALVPERRFDNWSFASLPEAEEGSEAGDGFILSLARGLR
jgi:hypothetical protein